MTFFEQLDLEKIIKALNETLYMTGFSLVFVIVLGLLIALILYVSSDGSLMPNKFINRIADFIINVLRAIPFIILMIVMFPLATMLTGSMLGVKAALPSLIAAAAPFYARLCVIAFLEVDKGVIEASKSMGASNWEIIHKVLIPESLPALISGACVTAISLISYSAMAGAIGSGGLGNLAYLYGAARRNPVILWTSTTLIVILVFAIQGLSDFVVKKIDKR